ncbi:MAG TPA: hypothetical protein ENK19_10540 [Acidobacteria bacterium]|nr:hypothetical protein [Acidobacteriota bacterium]
MPRQAYYRRLFLVGAIWNWVAAGTFVLGYRLIFPILGMAQPVYPVFFLMFLGLCFMFGNGYHWVSRDLTRNHGIVKLGIIGKLIVFGGLTWAGLTGQVHLILIVPGVVDLVFAVLYLGFLRNFTTPEV